MDYSVVSSEHNQLHWVELETKIILVKTRGICYLHYRQLAGLKRVLWTRSSKHLIYFPVFPRRPHLFLLMKEQNERCCFHGREGCVLASGNKRWPSWTTHFNPYKTESLLSVTPRQGRLNHLPSRLVQGKETHLLFCPLHRNLFFSIAFPLNSCSNS